MIERISSPKVGDGLRASWGASVASAINRLAEPALKEEMLPNQRNRLPKTTEQQEDKDTLYDCDGHSISRIALSSSDAEHLPTHGNRFQLMHFGKYLPHGETVPQGSFVPPRVLAIDQYEKGGTTDAVIVREGNSPQTDANFIGYKRLVFRSHSEPFLYSCRTEYDQNTGEAKANPIRTFENCVFYFDGVEQWIDPIQPPLDGTVYLVSTKEASGVWMHEMSGNPGAAPSGGDVINIKLYDFEGGKVTVDYRSVSLCVSSTKMNKSLSFGGTEVAKIAATKSVDISQLKLVQGEGIKIEQTTVDGKPALKISATAAPTAVSTFSGTFDVVGYVGYDDGGAYLDRKVCKLIIENGVVKDFQVPEFLDHYHSAVQES